MVEFGLKLEDNKVAEWSDYYIRYEQLKKILKKCQTQWKRFTELKNKDEALGNSMLSLWKDGQLSKTPTGSLENLPGAVRSNQGTPSSTPPRPSREESAHVLDEHDGNNNTTLRKISEISERNSEEAEDRKPLAETPALVITEDSRPPIGKPPIVVVATEQSALLESSPGQKKTASYGSQRKGLGLTRSESGGSVGSGVARAILRTTSGMTSFFTYPLERQMKEALLQMETHSKEFEIMIQKDIRNVNEFYDEKLHDLEDRLSFLKETVNGMGGAKGQRAASVGSDDEAQIKDEDVATPLIKPSHRRTKSPLDFAKSLVRMSRLKMTQSDKEAAHRFDGITNIGLDEDVADADSEEKGSDNAQRLREAESVQRAIVDLYRQAKLLHNYAIMNYTGFVKIVKKHDKTLPEDKNKYKQAIQPSQICDEGKAVEDYANRLEKHYAIWFCGGNHSEARAQMLPKKGDSLEMDWSQLRLGYRLGMCTVLGVWVCWDCVWGFYSLGSSTIGERAAFPVFRACGGLLVLQWFWGMSTWVWSRYRINYIYLFDFDPRIVESPLKIFNEAVDNTLVFLICMLLYYKAGTHDIPGGDLPEGVFPFLLAMYTLIQLIVPLRTRVPMWISIYRLVTAPLTSPSFYHGYVGDIFTSMVKVFQDWAWTLLFLFTGDWLESEDTPHSHKHKWAKSNWYKHVLIPLLTLLPLWFRFNQCLRRYADTGNRFPHLANAFKYALSQTVTLFGAFHPLYMDMHSHRESNVFQLFWMCAFIGSSLYSFAWDVYMDWGLGRPKYNFLGPRLMYPKKGIYYAIILLDLILRFAWVLTLIPPDAGATFALPHYLTAVSLVLELYRRTVWGFLRLENEHRSNTAGYRRVGFVPLHFTTGHMHEYKQETKHRGFSVLLEVAIITVLVVGISFGSVVAAQHATQRTTEEL